MKPAKYWRKNGFESKLDSWVRTLLWLLCMGVACGITGLGAAS